MENCIFCKIVSGKIPSYKIYENNLFYSFLDVFPKTKGHTLIIPKKHYRWVYDVPEFGVYWETALTVTKAVQKALKPEWVSYLTVGLIAPHAHIHIIPRYEKITGDSSGKLESLPNQKLSFSKEEMQAMADSISKAL